MSNGQNAAIVVHGGGPSPVLNASLVGIIDACRRSKKFDRLYGARFGAHGLLRDDWIDLGSLSSELLGRIRRAPGSVLGSSRAVFDQTDVAPVLDVCRKRGVGTIFFTGGNGSMKTALLFHRAANLTVIGVPKTVDNDLAGTYHCPGFGSAARFYAYAVRDIGADNRALPASFPRAVDGGRSLTPHQSPTLPVVRAGRYDGCHRPSETARTEVRHIALDDERRWFYPNGRSDPDYHQYLGCPNV